MSITRAQVALVISMYMVGLLIGSFGCGWLGDKIGEKDTVKDSFVRQKEDADVGSYNLLRVLISWSLHAGIRLLHGHQVTPHKPVTLRQAGDGHRSPGHLPDGLCHVRGDHRHQVSPGGPLSQAAGAGHPLGVLPDPAGRHDPGPLRRGQRPAHRARHVHPALVRPAVDHLLGHLRPGHPLVHRP